MSAAQQAGRLPPHDLAVESAVLSACMLASEAVDACGNLRPEHFYSPANRIIYGAILELHAAGQSADVLTVARQLRERELLTKVGGAAYLGRIVDESPAVAHVGEHAAILVALALRRAVIAAAHSIAAEGYQHVEDPSTWAEQAAKRLQSVVVTGRPRGGWQWVTAEGLDEQLPPIPWVIEGLEIAPGFPTLVAGYGYSAKTVTAQALALAVATGRPALGVFPVRQGKVRHIDYEQGQRLTLERYQRLGRVLGIKFSDLGDSLGFVPLPREKLDDPSIENLLVRELEGITLAIFDSFRAGAPRTDENSSEASEPLRMLGRVSEATGCAIIVIHHARKTNEGDSDERQIIRGSSGIFDACQSVWTFVAKKGEPTRASCAKARCTGRKLETFVIHVEDVAKDGDERWGMKVRYEEEANASVEAEGRRRQDLEDTIVELLKGRPGSSGNWLAIKLRERGHRLANGAIVFVLEDLQALGRVAPHTAPNKRGVLWSAVR
jgi:hypothetical protein